MYKYSLEEDNLLTPPEGTVDTRARPSALTGDMLNLNALEAPAPESLPEAPAPAPAPVGPAVTSYQEEIAKAAPKMFSPHFTQEEWDAAKARQKAANEEVAKTGETAESRLVSAAPSWYEQKKPPPSHGGWADAANMLGGVLAAGPNQALKDPRRPMDLKVQDAKKAAMATGLSTLLSNLFTHGQTDYKANQDAALKEAQMMKTVPGGKSASQIKREGADKLMDQMHQDAVLGSLETNRKFNQEHIDAELDPNDPQAIAWRKSLIAQGIAPEEVDGLGRKALQGTAAAHNITLSAGHTAGQKTADEANKERQIVLEQKVKQDAKLDDELRAERHRRGEGFIPDVDWVNNTPPPGHAVEDVRELWKTKKGFTDRLERMQQIQTRIEQIAAKYAADHGLTGGAAEALNALGPLAKWTEKIGGPEVHDLVNEATILQTSIQNFVRSKSYANLGVMQQWEDLKTRMDLPVAGSVTAYLRGPASWKALSNDVNRMFEDGVTAAGGVVRAPGKAPTDNGARTPEQERAEHPAPAIPEPVQYNPRTRTVGPRAGAAAPTDVTPTGATPPVPDATPPNAEDQAKIDTAKGRAGAPAPAPAAQAAPKLEAGQKMYKITKKDGKTADKAMTPEDAKLLGSHTDVIASVVEI